MELHLRDRTAKVLVVEQQDVLRAALTQAVRELGFSHINGMSNLKSAFKYLEISDEPPTWIISTISQNTEVNAFHLLKLCIEQPRFQGTRVSFILGEDFYDCIPNAIELGLMSWHPTFNSLGQIKNQIQELLDIGLKRDWEGPLIAALYLATHLNQKKKHEEVVILLRSLITKYPNQPGLALQYAEALLLAGKTAQGLAAIKAVRDAHPNVEAEATALENRFVKKADGDPELDSLSFAEEHDLGSAFIIDPDAAVQNLLTQALTEIGVGSIHAFRDGNEALAKLAADDPPQLIIQEWKIGGISGPAFVQRVRSKHHTLPIIVHSSIVKKHDRLLVREMGVSDIIEKPLYKKDLVNRIKEIVIQESGISDARVVEKKVRSRLSARDFTSARSMIDQLSNSKENLGVKALLEAEYEFARNNTRKAKDLAIESLHSGGESLILLNLMGKILMKLKEYELARQFFERAQKISPQNIERLCALAEIHEELGNVNAADGAIKEARGVDKESQTIDQTEAKIAIIKGDTNKAKKLLENLDSAREIVAQLNNRAVLLAKENKSLESMKLYERALQSLPGSTEGKSLKSMIQYNMGLGSARQGDNKKASEFLQQAAVAGDASPVFRKITSLTRRVDDAIKTGKPLQLVSKSTQEDDSNQEFAAIQTSELPLAKDAKIGDMCCHLIYQSKDGVHPKVADLLDDMPRFRFLKQD